MVDILLIAGSPSAGSRSALLLDYCGAWLAQAGAQVAWLRVRDLPAQDLVWGDYKSPAIQAAGAQIAAARAVVVATPVYKAAYAGVLKALVDLLPADCLRGKLVLPLVMGGSLAHSLALDLALKPLLTAIGADHVLRGVYAVDAQLQGQDLTSLELEASLSQALEPQLEQLMSELNIHRPEAR